MHHHAQLITVGLGISVIIDLALCFQLAVLSWGKPIFGDLFSYLKKYLCKIIPRLPA